MAPGIFGHGKRIGKLEEGVGAIRDDVKSVDGKLDRVLDVLNDEGPEQPGPDNGGYSSSLPPPATDSYNQKLNSLEQEIVNCKDPIRLQELLEMEKTTRRWYNARQSARLRKLHPPNPYGRRGAEPREEDYEPTDAVIHDVETELGQSNGKQFDPGKMFGSLQGLIAKHPTWAQMIAKQMGIEDLDGAMKMFGQVVSDPAKQAELASMVGGGISGVIKGAVDKYKSLTPAPPGGGLVPPPQQGNQLINVGGQMIDPTKPYKVG